jgi:hypothetical protein
MSEDKRFYGLYRAICTFVDDPENRNRIKVKVPQVLGETKDLWAEPCLPVTSNSNHPDHKMHLASEVAALLVNHSGTFTSSTSGAHSHTTTVTFTHTGNSLKLDHEHETDPDEDEKWNDDQEVNTTAEHTPHRLVPAIDQKVWVMFIGGDTNFPVWMGVEL